MKVLPVRVDLFNVLAVAESFGTLLYTVPGSLHEASVASSRIPAIVRSLLLEEELQKAAEIYESDELKNKKAELQSLEEAWANGLQNKLSRPELMEIASKVEAVEAEIKKLDNIDGMILARANEMFGKEEIDYTSDILEWRQQARATSEWLKNEFGVEKYGNEGSLVLFPAVATKPFWKADDGNIAVAFVTEDKELKVVAILPKKGDNSTFFKTVNAIVGKDKATNGVNSVSHFNADEYKVVVSGKCKRLYKAETLEEPK